MDADQFHLAEDLFHQAMSLPADDRPQFIQNSTAGDPELQTRVLRLLRFAEHSGETAQLIIQHQIDEPAEISDTQLVGQTLGPYQVTGVIGEGGFGSVYRAQQEHPVRRTVALKVLKTGMDSRKVIARFQAERQTLAIMDHPGIARVLDAGQLPPEMGSRPYFVMELVSGQPITDFCQANRLEWKDRLELFISVCQAVQHAHQKGIIHRDLKPSNIMVRLVDGKPAATIIDFGIAKAMHGIDGVVNPMVTQQMELLGTPQYMSPEQATGGNDGIDTRSDIYSLGVVLYQLLTGTTPLEEATMQHASYVQMQRMIQDEATERPSVRLKKRSTSRSPSRKTAAAGESRGDGAGGEDTSTEIDQLVSARQLRGDLDWIVLKALEKDPQRRYATASEFAEDVRRHLNDEPVLAGPPSAMYRTGKFIRRHRFGVAAAIVVVLAVMGGAVGTTIGMMRARDAATAASEVNQFMHDVLTSVDPNKGKGAGVRLSDVLSNASKNAAIRFAGHPDLEGQVRHLIAEVYYHLAMWKESSQEYEREQKVWTSLAGPDDPRTLRAELARARAVGNIGLTREPRAIIDDLMPRVERTLGQNDPVWFQTQCTLAIIIQYSGDAITAEKIVREAWRRSEAVNLDITTRLILRETMVSVLLHVANLSEQDRMRLQSELPQMAQELYDLASTALGKQSLPAIRAHNMLGDTLLRYGRCDEAATIARAVLDGSADRLGECHDLRIKAMDIMSVAMYCKGEASQATDYKLKAIDCMRGQAGNLALLAELYDSLPTFDRADRSTDGEQLAREVSGIIKSMGGGHGAMQFTADLFIARFVSLQGRYDEADALFSKLFEREIEASDEPRTQARLHMFYGEHLTAIGKLNDAQKQLDIAAGLLQNINEGTSPRSPDDLIAAYIDLYQKNGESTKLKDYQKRLQLALQNWRIGAQ